MGYCFLFMVNICTVTLLKNKRQMILFFKTHITLFTTEPFNNLLVFCLFVCLGVFRHSRIFYSYGDVTIAGEGLQILTEAQHSWPPSSEGSLACNTYCDTGHPYIKVIPEDSCHSHLLPSVRQWSCHYLFLRLGLGLEHPIFRMRG